MGLSVHVLSYLCVCLAVFVSVGVAGRGRLPSVYEALEETGGWCVERLSSTPAGSLPQHTASRGQTHSPDT